MRATDSSQLPQRHKPQTTTETSGGSLSREFAPGGRTSPLACEKGQRVSLRITPSKGVAILPVSLLLRKEWDFVWLCEDVLFI